MEGFAYHQPDITSFGYLTPVQHDDVLADLVGRGQVVRDVEHGDPEFGVQQAQAFRIVARSEASTIDTGSSAMINRG